MSSDELDTLLRNSNMTMPSNVPYVVAKQIDETLHALPDRSKLMRTTQRLRRWGVAVATLVLVGGSIASYTAFAPDKQSEVIPTPAGAIHTNESRYIRNAMEHSALAFKSETVWASSITDNGITLKIGKIVYDGNELGFQYSVTSEEPIEAFALNAEVKLNNGVVVGKLGVMQDGTYGNLGNEYEQLSPGEYRGIISTESLIYKNFLKPSTFQLKFEVFKIGTVTGKWSIETEGLIDKNQTIITHKETRTSKYGTIDLNKITLSSMSMQVDYWFTEGNIGVHEGVGVDVTDDTGYHYGGAVFNFSQSDTVRGPLGYAPILSEAKTLIIRPFYYDWRLDYQKNIDFVRTPVVEQPTLEKPLAIPLGEAGNVYVTNIEYLADQTLIHTYTRSEDTGGGFNIEDEKGQSIPIISWGVGGKVRFAPVDPDSKLTFVSRPYSKRIYIPDMEIRVDLPPK